MAKKQKYKIKMIDGTWQEVEGEVVNKIWGIDKRTQVSGEKTMKDGTVKALSSTSYIVTHLPTGAFLPTASFRTIKAAKLLLSRPEFFIDELNEENAMEMARAIAEFWNERGWKD